MSFQTRLLKRTGLSCSSEDIIIKKFLIHCFFFVRMKPPNSSLVVLYTLFLTIPACTVSLSNFPDFHPPVDRDVRRYIIGDELIFCLPSTFTDLLLCISPCPVLNSLANHDLLPHSGKDITEEQLNEALGSIGISSAIGSRLSSGAMKLGTKSDDGVTRLDLDQLNKYVNDLSLFPYLMNHTLRRHGRIEHDASLSRADFSSGDNHSFNMTIFSRAEKYLSENSSNGGENGDDRRLTFQGLARWRAAVELNCQTSNPECQLSLKAKTLGTAEASLIYLFLKQDDSIPYSSLKILFVDERIPDRTNEVGLFPLLTTMANLRARQLFAHDAEDDKPDL